MIGEGAAAAPDWLYFPLLVKGLMINVMCCTVKPDFLFQAASCLCFDRLNMTGSCQPELVEGLSKAYSQACRKRYPIPISGGH
jgi:hypothetical protein